jgi:hypothetical protein
MKLGYTIWFVIWLPAYVFTHAPVEFLWFCHIGNVLLLFGLWYEQSLLISWQAVSLLLLQSLWTADFVGRLLLGIHVFGGTNYMFRSDFPIYQWLLSAYHIPFPVLLGYVLWKVGYDTRAFSVQSVSAAVVLCLSFVFDNRDPKWNINWVYGLFAQRQTWANDYVYLFLSVICYPIVVYLPSHLFFWLAVPRHNGGGPPRAELGIPAPSNRERRPRWTIA